MDAGLLAILEQHKPYLQREEDGRIKCTLNSHILPAKKDVVESFVQGAKYQRLRQKKEEEAGFSKYEPFLIGSKNHADKLYCAMTCMLVNRNLDSIRKHMKGKAFLKAKEKFEKDEHDLMEEPDLEESEPESSGQATEQPSEVLEGFESMELDCSPSADSAEAAEAAAVPGKQNGQSQGKKKNRKPKAKRSVTSEGAPQPSTPPRVQLAAPSSERKEKSERLSKRWRGDGSRPKKLKRAAV